jgi:hypothetical protein
MREAVVMVAGPTGVGKTSLVTLLSAKGAAYVEDGSRNPFLNCASTPGFDAISSQRWFLGQIATFLDHNPSGILVIDQHPLVISRVYGLTFYREGLLTRDDVRDLDEHATCIERCILAESQRVLTVCLTASTESLLARLARRAQNRLPVRLVEELNLLYGRVVFTGDCIVCNTDLITKRDEAVVVESWLSTARSFQE